MLLETHGRYRKSSPSRRHPAFYINGLDFIARPAKFKYAACIDLPVRGTLTLWRFRAEWLSTSREQAYSWLSAAELRRAKNYPNSALSKRYLVGRSMLRLILSRMLDCDPKSVVLADGTDGQPVMTSPQARGKVRIHVANAGIWMIVGLSQTDLGIGVVFPGSTSQSDRTSSMSFWTGTPITLSDGNFSAHEC
ncbi:MULTISPECIES: hypothetical protein [unclassified Caballeronia]|uniref:4'-phosphopantetheinyl transferase family protein n=1 Tax=unclassified Caballeronia TaxID=2646786 RepID=UPI002859C3C0|nr:MULTISPECIES: hypothetical protein [unclassified Caballeronia]MDR5798696.1 hypothetical protein [Caballeronia sp. LZ001]